MRGLSLRGKLISLFFILILLNIGCESSLRTYLKEEAPLHKIRKVAIIPFDNSSKDKNAGDKLASIFSIELLTSKQFGVVEAGEVERALKEVKVRAKGGVSTLEIADTQKIGEALGVDAVILGKIDTFESGKKDNPVISMNIHMLDTRDGALVWNVDYTATGGSFAYILDFGKISSVNMLSRRMVRKMLAPLIKKARNSLKEAESKIQNAREASEEAEIVAKDLKTRAEDLEIEAKETEDRFKDLESRAKQSENEALRINPEALARKVSELHTEMQNAGNRLNTLMSISKKKVTLKASIDGKINAKESEVKGHKDKLDEITGQINIFTAKQRVAAIRGNQEEADNYKKKAGAAKTEASKIQADYDNAQRKLGALKKDLGSVVPDVEKAQAEEKEASDILDSLKASLAEVNKMQAALSKEEIGPEQMAMAKIKESEAKKIRNEANKAKAESKRLTDMAEQARKKSDEAMQSAEAAMKFYEDTRTRLE